MSFFFLSNCSVLTPFPDQGAEVPFIIDRENVILSTESWASTFIPYSTFH